MDNRQKQSAYRQRMKGKGLVQVTEWVPEVDRALFRQIAADLREGKRVQTAPPPRPVSTAPTPAVSPHSRPDYPPEVKRLALELTNRGTAPAKIRDEIKARCGRSPDGKNWGKIIRSWRVWAAREDAGRGK